MTNLSTLLTDHPITLTLDAGSPSPEFSAPGAHHYSATLSLDGRTMTVPYHTGSGWTTDPTVRDVLECLLSDASGHDNARDFNDWAAELGFSTDQHSDPTGYRNARRIWAAVVKQTAQLRDLLGDAYETWVYADQNEETV